MILALVIILAVVALFAGAVWLASHRDVPRRGDESLLPLGSVTTLCWHKAARPFMPPFLAMDGRRMRSPARGTVR